MPIITMQDLRDERAAKITQAKSIVDRAQTQGRQVLTPTEQDDISGAMARVKELDKQIKGKALVESVLSLGTVEDHLDAKDGTRFLSLRSPGVKADLAARFGSELGGPGTRALVDYSSPYTSISMAPEPFRMEQAPTSLLEILPAIQRPVVYRYMKQTTRQNNAAPVARARWSRPAPSGWNRWRVGSGSSPTSQSRWTSTRWRTARPWPRSCTWRWSTASTRPSRPSSWPATA